MVDALGLDIDAVNRRARADQLGEERADIPRAGPDYEYRHVLAFVEVQGRERRRVNVRCALVQRALPDRPIDVDLIRSFGSSSSSSSSSSSGGGDGV